MILKFLDLAPKLAPEAKSSSLREAGTRLGFRVSFTVIFWLFTIFRSGNATSKPDRTRASDVTNRVRSLVARVLIRILLSWASLQRPLYSLLAEPALFVLKVLLKTMAKSADYKIFKIKLWDSP